MVYADTNERNFSPDQVDVYTEEDTKLTTNENDFKVYNDEKITRVNVKNVENLSSYEDDENQDLRSNSNNIYTARE